MLVVSCLPSYTKSCRRWLNGKISPDLQMEILRYAHPVRILCRCGSAALFTVPVSSFCGSAAPRFHDEGWGKGRSGGSG